MLEWKVKDISIDKDSTIKHIIDEMLNSGFMAKHLALASNILNDMLKDEGCLKFLSFVGAIIASGARGIIRDMLKYRMFDVVITTCGALDHDIAKAYADYYTGDFDMDDYRLTDEHIHRLGNLLVPLDNYGPLIEKVVQQVLEESYTSGVRELSSSDLCYILGKDAGESSFLYWAYKNNIPVFVPGIMDGAVGTQVWLFAQRHKDFRLNLLKDADRLAELVFNAKKSGALMIGGGISKHHTLWWNQFKGGLDYVVYITTAVEYDGSLSGALVREAVSWGKVNVNARHVTVYGEATLILPFLYASMLNR